MLSHRLLENLLDLLGLLGVDTLNGLDLLAVLEDDDGGEGVVLELLPGTGVLVDVDLVGLGVVGVLVSGPVRRDLLAIWASCRRVFSWRVELLQLGCNCERVVSWMILM